MTTDELVDVMVRLRRRPRDMDLANLKDALSERGQCSGGWFDRLTDRWRNDYQRPADYIVFMGSTQGGSEAFPVPRCAEHAGAHPEVAWEDGAWSWLRRSYWDEPGPSNGMYF